MYCEDVPRERKGTGGDGVGEKRVGQRKNQVQRDAYRQNAHVLPCTHTGKTRWVGKRQEREKKEEKQNA